MKLRYNDKVHGYWLNGRRVKAVTTAAKVPEDGYALDQWRKRMVLLGAAEQPAILNAVERYSVDKDVLDELAETAMREAGAWVKAEKGTATHATVESHLKGESVDDAYTAARYQMMLDAAGFTADPTLVERMVVYPVQRIAGRFDHIAYRPDGRPAVVDLKTGASAVRYPHSTVIQLALYANAPSLAGELEEIEPGVWQTEDFTDLPEGLDTDEGYVIFMDDDEVAVYALNLKLGWKCAEEIVFPTLRWRALPHERLIKRVA